MIWVDFNRAVDVRTRSYSRLVWMVIYLLFYK